MVQDFRAHTCHMAALYWIPFLCIHSLHACMSTTPRKCQRSVAASRSIFVRELNACLGFQEAPNKRDISQTAAAPNKRYRREYNISKQFMQGAATPLSVYLASEGLRTKDESFQITAFIMK